MIIVAVIVGYLLGITPFVIPKAIDLINSFKSNKTREEERKEEQDILDEWLNGPKEKNEVNQQEIYNEYMTGIVSNRKGE